LPLAGLIAFIAWRAGSLSHSGALAATVIGSLVFGFGGWRWGIILALFFVSSSLLSHFRQGQKLDAAEKFAKGHRRDYGQVAANGGLAAIAAVLSWITVADYWYFILIGLMAAVTADTWATELGTLSRAAPRLITNGRQVETGTSGGVSLLGTVVSALGGLLIGLAAGVLHSSVELGVASLAGLAAGLVGSLFDSFLGATWQRVYFCPHCDKETEQPLHRCGNQATVLRGFGWLNNDVVNLLASVAGAAVAYLVWSILGRAA